MLARQLISMPVLEQSEEDAEEDGQEAEGRVLMNVRIVTSHNPDHWSTYARRNLQSMVDFLPHEIVSYHEEVQEPEGVDSHRLVWRHLWNVPGVRQFVQEAVGFPPAKGKFNGRYDYNFDVHKFCRKVYAQCDAALEGCDVLIWLDSDVEVLAPLSDGQIENAMNGQPMAIYQRNNMHSECGIVMWDMRHPVCSEFFRHYRHLYDSRRIYTIQGGWHDCWALDAVVRALKIVPTNLSRHPERIEVVSSSDLAFAFRHDKGMTKHVAA